MARPRIELTEKIQQRICEALRIGASLHQAAQYAGISRQTLRRWIKRGKTEKNGEFQHLWQEIEKAKAHLAMSLLLTINHAAKNHWKAAVWLLERTYRAPYDKPANPAIAVDEANEKGV